MPSDRQSAASRGGVKLKPDARAAPIAPDAALGVAASSGTRAFSGVQQVCNHACTFSIVTQGQGPAPAMPVATAVTAVRNLAQHHAEVVLTGLDLASHPGPATLIHAVLRASPDLPRLRLSPPDPAALNGPFWRMSAGEPRLMPHMDPSVQHGHELKRMRRPNSRTGPLQLVARARAAGPDVAFGADLIAGFPTGTEGRLCTLLDLMAEGGLTFPHLLICSACAGTPAARMPQSPMALRRERAAGGAPRARLPMARLRCIEHVLVEADGRGHTPHFAPSRISGASRGARIAACVTASDRQTLMAEAA